MRHEPNSGHFASRVSVVTAPIPGMPHSHSRRAYSQDRRREDFHHADRIHTGEAGEAALQANAGIKRRGDFWRWLRRPSFFCFSFRSAYVRISSFYPSHSFPSRNGEIFSRYGYPDQPEKNYFLINRK
jgi:hypothetical protein